MSRKPRKANRSNPLELFQGLQFHGCLLSDFDDGDELRGPSRECPLWVKSRHSAPHPFMSAIGGKADIGEGLIRNRDLNVRYWG